MNILIITEKPSVAREISKVISKSKLSDNYTAIGLVGHVIGLIDPDAYCPEWANRRDSNILPMIPSKFKTQITEPNVFNKVADTIKSGKFDLIVNGCDAGREGELIFQLFIEKVESDIPVKRLWLSAQNEKAVLAGLANLKDDREYDNLKNAAKLRSYIDWLLGMNLSRAISIATKSSIPLGRVMTPTLNIIVQRELEIQNFISKPFYEINCKLGKPETDIDWMASYINDENKSKIEDKSMADNILNSISDKASVCDIKRKKVVKPAPEFYNLTALQQDANKLFGYTAKATLEIAQSLYETHKCLSYPRTDATVLTEEMGDIIPDILNSFRNSKEFAGHIQEIDRVDKINKIISDKRYFNNAKVTDHYALSPTGTIAGNLAEREQNIFSLVVRRFLGPFMGELVTDNTEVVFDSNGNRLITKGLIVVDSGYTKLYKESTDKTLPDFSMGEIVHVLNKDLLSKSSNPPSRYTEATLLGAMKNASRLLDDKKDKENLKSGIGTSATRADVIEKLKKNSMVTEEKKLFKPSQFSMDIVDALNGRKISSVELSAEWEGRLSDIEKGIVRYEDIYEEMIAMIKEYTGDILTIDKRVKNPNSKPYDNSLQNETYGICPICGKNVTGSRYYYFCESYAPKDQRDDQSCTFIASNEHVTVKDMTIMLAGEETEEKTMKNKSGREYTAKLKIIDGKVTPVFQNTSNFDSFSVLGKCPSCGKNIVDGTNFYICTGKNQGCSFIVKKIIQGGDIKPEVMKALLEGEKSDDILFTWKNGKSSHAKLKLDGCKLEFLFT